MYQDEFLSSVLPVQYDYGENNSWHPLLEKSGWYQALDLLRFSGVKTKGIWVPHEGSGVTGPAGLYCGAVRWRSGMGLGLR
jgi:hypothetical protein